MPEPEMVTVMHNAKFDLSVLKRTGLPLPEKWECTKIASHLLNEIGNRGLKPLAKEHLGIDDAVNVSRGRQSAGTEPRDIRGIRAK